MHYELRHYDIRHIYGITALRHYGIYGLRFLITVITARAVTVIIISTASICILNFIKSFIQNYYTSSNFIINYTISDLSYIKFKFIFVYYTNKIFFFYIKKEHNRHAYITLPIIC